MRTQFLLCRRKTIFILCPNRRRHHFGQQWVFNHNDNGNNSHSDESGCHFIRMYENTDNCYNDDADDSIALCFRILLGQLSNHSKLDAFQSFRSRKENYRL